MSEMLGGIPTLYKASSQIPLEPEVLLQGRHGRLFPLWYYCTDPVVYISHHCPGTHKKNGNMGRKERYELHV